MNSSADFIPTPPLRCTKNTIAIPDTWQKSHHWLNDNVRYKLMESRQSGLLPKKLANLPWRKANSKLVVACGTSGEATGCCCCCCHALIFHRFCIWFEQPGKLENKNLYAEQRRNMWSVTFSCAVFLLFQVFIRNCCIRVSASVAALEHRVSGRWGVFMQDINCTLLQLKGTARGCVLFRVTSFDCNLWEWFFHYCSPQIRNICTVCKAVQYAGDDSSSVQNK